MLKVISESEVPKAVLERKQHKKHADFITAGDKELDDSALDDISGGFRKNNGYAKGHSIVCPYCSSKSKGDITTWEDSDNKMSLFLCEECGAFWGVDKNGTCYEFGGQ